MKRIFGFIGLTLLVFASLSTATVHAQSSQPTASLTFKFSSFEVTTGKNFTFDVEVDTGGPTVNIVQACVNYDHAKFDFVSVNFDNTPFKSEVPKSSTSGCKATSLQIARYGLGNWPTGKFTLAHVTLKPKAQSGVATFGFDFDKSLVLSPTSPEKNILKETANAQLTITSATPATPKSVTKNFLYLGIALLVVAACIFALVTRKARARGRKTTEKPEE